MLAKDYSEAIRSGFEATGLHPLNRDRILDKMPAERASDTDVVSNVQQQLINQLAALRYKATTTTRAARPKKSQKLPAGAAYTCTGKGSSRYFNRFYKKIFRLG